MDKEAAARNRRNALDCRRHGYHVWSFVGYRCVMCGITKDEAKAEADG